MKIDVARVVSSGATDVEPARAFLQDRIRLWAFWVFVLSFGFYLTNIVTWTFVLHLSHAVPWRTDAPVAATSITSPPRSCSAASGCCRRWRLSMEALCRILDVTALILGCTLYAVMGGYLMRPSWLRGSTARLAAMRDCWLASTP